MRFMVSFAIIGVALAIIAYTFIFILAYEYLRTGDYLGIIALYVTGLMPAIALMIYFVKKIYETNDERKLASRNMYGELRDSLIILKNSPKDLLDYITDDKCFTYTNRFLNHNVYDSLVYSGKISFLRFESQQKIQDVMKKIKNHNYYLRYIDELNDKDDNGISKIAYRYYEYLDRSERQLIKEIPEIMDELKKEFKFKEISRS